MRSKTEKLYLWASEKANSKRASLWVGVLFLLEIFLFVPLDALLVFFSLQNRRKIFPYIALAAVASTISGCIGYFAGHLVWDAVKPYLVPYVLSPSLLARMSAHFVEYEHWAIFLGSLLPFPLKALSLSSGMFHLPLPSFIFCLITARLTRFALLGGAVALWGEKMKTFLDKHFHSIMILLLAKVALACLFFYLLAQ